MATQINRVTGVIFVPRADMTLVQSNPTEIRELDLNQWRLILRDLDDDVDGRLWPDTHSHNEDVIVGGVSLADVLIISDYYTVTFEDGQYAVNLRGLNSNVGDRVNVNQVSVRSANSAGLVNSRAIESIEYDRRVTLDQNNVTGNSRPGSVAPTGTLRQPSDNVGDTLIIAAFNGFDTIHLIGDVLFTTGDTINDLTIHGQNPTRSLVTIDAAANCLNCEFENSALTGVLDGGSIIKDCVIIGLNYINGTVKNCRLDPTFNHVLGGTSADYAFFNNCTSGQPGPTTPVIDCGGDGPNLFMSGYSGGLKLINKTGTAAFTIGLGEGSIIIDLDTVTNGTIIIRGDGHVTDQLGNHLDSGTYGTLTLINQTVDGAEIHEKVSEMWSRSDLNPDTPNTYANDASSISNDKFTITRTDNGNGTFTTQRS